MMIFEVIDKTGRKIRLTDERRKHITSEHPDIVDIEEIKNTLKQPFKISPSKYNPDNVAWYYRYNKKLSMYLFVAVKYLNGDGFIITTYYMKSIK